MLDPPWFYRGNGWGYFVVVFGLCCRCCCCCFWCRPRRHCWSFGCRFGWCALRRLGFCSGGKRKQCVDRRLPRLGYKKRARFIFSRSFFFETEELRETTTCPISFFLFSSFTTIHFCQALSNNFGWWSWLSPTFTKSNSKRTPLVWLNDVKCIRLGCFFCFSLNF